MVALRKPELVTVQGGLALERQTAEDTAAAFREVDRIKAELRKAEARLADEIKAYSKVRGYNLMPLRPEFVRNQLGLNGGSR